MHIWAWIVKFVQDPTRMNFLLIPLFVIVTIISAAQVHFMAGPCLSSVRTRDVSIDQASLFGATTSISAQMYPFKSLPEFSIEPGVYYARKGYTQTAGGENFVFRIPYVGYHLAITYNITNHWQASCGGFINNHIERAESLIFQKDRYADREAGLMFSVRRQLHDFIGIIVRYDHGLSPILDYHHIDSYGNILDSGSDFRLSVITIGIELSTVHKLLLYNE